MSVNSVMHLLCMNQTCNIITLSQCPSGGYSAQTPETKFKFTQFRESNSPFILYFEENVKSQFLKQRHPFNHSLSISFWINYKKIWIRALIFWQQWSHPPLRWNDLSEMSLVLLSVNESNNCHAAESIPSVAVKGLFCLEEKLWYSAPSANKIYGKAAFIAELVLIVSEPSKNHILLNEAAIRFN